MRLTVTGTGDRGDTVTVVNAFQTTQVLGTSRVGGNLSWSVRANRPVPVPCSVTASAPGDANVTVAVAGAPADCAPKPPNVNNPPVCVIDEPRGNVTITTGGSVSYLGTVTDPDGDPVTITWVFNGGTPGGSDVEDPGTVTYETAGVFTTTLNASDNRGGNCVEQTRQVTVQNLQLPNVSVNSTSRSCGPAADAKDPNPPACSPTPVPERPSVGNAGSHAIVAINDLGMHCGDLDTRIPSILPPFQVLLAQVIQKGAQPQLLGPTQAQVFYSAVRNPNDPALALSGQVCGTDVAGNPIPCAGVYKP